MRGRTYAIPGATGSLGPHVAEALLEAGAHVALGGRDERALSELAARLEGGDRVSTRAVDLVDAGDAQAWARELGDVDGVVHLVGGWRGGEPLATAPASDWEDLEPALIRTVQNVTRAFHDHLVASGSGRFVLLSAKGALAPSHTNAAYAAAKAAAEAWTFALADGFAQSGATATANVVAVNALVTPQMRAQSPDKPFRTFADVADVAQTIAWVCSDACATMNGQRVALHG